MSKVAEKLEDLEYNEQVVLTIVEGDDDLRDIFTEEIDVKSFNILRTLAKENQLNSETQSFLKKIFEGIILTKQDLIDKYKLLISRGDVAVIEVVPTPSVSKAIEPIPIKSAETKKTKPKAEKELPRRYGKESILKDIQAQGGKATPLQNAMLKVNDLKNIYVNLSARGIKDMVGRTNLISDEDSRKIVSVITIVERQLADILKKK